MHGFLRLLGAGMTTALLVGSLGFCAQPDETSVIAASLEQGVLIVRHRSPVTDANGRSEQPTMQNDAVPPLQDASRSAESTDDPAPVIRREPTEAGEENRLDAAGPNSRAQQAVPFLVDAVLSNPPAWISLRTSLSDTTNRAWSLHANPSWSYHPHALSYHPKRYQGFGPRRSWKYQPVHRQKYRPKRDWTYHPR